MRRRAKQFAGTSTSDYMPTCVAALDAVDEVEQLVRISVG